jgi:hypothetical protein
MRPCISSISQVKAPKEEVVFPGEEDERRSWGATHRIPLSWIALPDHGTNTAYVYQRKTLSHCAYLRVLLYTDLSSIALHQGPP